MATPVVMFGFNRPDIQKMSMKCYSECIGAGERDIFVFLDGPRNDADKQCSDQIETMLESYRNTQFPRMKIIRRDKNYGCRENIVQGITEVISKYGRVIIIEDDILVSKTFLKFMDAALDFYDNDHRIWCIDGFHDYTFKVPKDYKHDLYLVAYMSAAWGWATWKDRWEKVDFDMHDWPEYNKSPENVEKLDSVSYVLRHWLDAQYNGTLKTWDVQCWYHMVKNNYYAIEPRYQLSKNIGCVPKSEHFSGTNPFMIAQKFYNYMPKLERSIELDERILRRFRHCQFNPSIAVRIWRKLWRLWVRFTATPCYSPVDI